MPQDEITLHFPIAGIDRAMPFQLQPPYTTPHALNVWPTTSVDARQAGGSRCGIIEYATPSDGYDYGTSDVGVQGFGVMAGIPGFVSKHVIFDNPQSLQAIEHVSGRTLSYENRSAVLKPGSSTPAVYHLWTKHWLVHDSATASSYFVSTLFVRIIPDGERIGGRITIDYPWVEAGVAPGYAEGYAAQRIVLDCYGSVAIAKHYRMTGPPGSPRWPTNESEYDGESQPDWGFPNGHLKIYTVSGISVRDLITIRMMYIQSLYQGNDYDALRYSCWVNGHMMHYLRPGAARNDSYLPPNNRKSFEHSYPGCLQRGFPSGGTVANTKKLVRARLTIENDSSQSVNGLRLSEIGHLTPIVGRLTHIEGADHGAPKQKLAIVIAHAGRAFFASAMNMRPFMVLSWQADAAFSESEPFIANKTKIGDRVFYNGFSPTSAPIMSCLTTQGTVFADYDATGFMYPWVGTTNVQVNVRNNSGRIENYINKDVLHHTAYLAPRGLWVRARGLLVTSGAGHRGSVAIVSDVDDNGNFYLSAPISAYTTGSFSVHCKAVRMPKVAWSIFGVPRYPFNPVRSLLPDITQLGALRQSDLGRTVSSENDIVAGSVPYNCPIVVEYGGRVWFAGQPDSTGSYYGSRINQICDWDYGQEDPAAAVAGSLMEEGSANVAITALIPAGDDYMLICGQDRIAVMRGNIKGGGSIGMLSHEVGCVGRMAWARDESNNVYLLSTRGLMVVPYGAQARPVPLSKARMPRDLLGLSSLGYEPLMAWDSANGGIWIFLTARGWTHSAAWWYDVATQSLWPMQFGSNFSITAIMSHTDFMVGGNRLWVGNGAGKIGIIDPEARGDFGAAFDSEVVLGPLRPSSDGREGTLDFVEIGLADWSGNVHADVKGDYSGARACDFADGYVSEEFGPGINRRWHPRVRGHYAAVRLRNKVVGGGQPNTPWGYAWGKAGRSDAGQLRRP